jgi:hypothetical protein
LLPAERLAAQRDVRGVHGNLRHSNSVTRIGSATPLCLWPMSYSSYRGAFEMNRSTFGVIDPASNLDVAARATVPTYYFPFSTTSRHTIFALSTPPVGTLSSIPETAAWLHGFHTIAEWTSCTTSALHSLLPLFQLWLPSWSSPNSWHSYQSSSDGRKTRKLPLRKESGFRRMRGR